MDLELQNLEEKSYKKSMGFKSWKIIALLTLSLLLSGLCDEHLCCIQRYFYDLIYFATNLLSKYFCIGVNSHYKHWTVQFIHHNQGCSVGGEGGAALPHYKFKRESAPSLYLDYCYFIIVKVD